MSAVVVMVFAMFGFFGKVIVVGVARALFAGGAIEAGAKFFAGVRGDDAVEPRGFSGLVFRSEDFDNIPLLKTGVEAAHFAVNFNTDYVVADFRVEAIGKIERKCAPRQVDDIAFRSVEKNLVGKEIEFELAEIDFLPFAKARGGHLELVNPEEISGEMLDFAFFVVFGKFLLVVIEASGEPALGVFVHGFGANLKLDDAFVFGDDGSVEGLITVLFRHSDVVFDAAVHWHIKGVDKAEN